MESCWICSKPADSAEHMVKASDFRDEFGQVTQGQPVFVHSKLGINVPIRGAKSQLLKFRPSLCSHCNNARTQPHDQAWQALSELLRNRQPPVRRGQALPIAEAFGPGGEAAMLNVHFFFLKLLGCYAIEHGVPLPTRYFAAALLASIPYPDLYLAFVEITDPADSNCIWVSDIKAIAVGACPVAASWAYIVGRLGVHVQYCEPKHPRLHDHRGWHPSHGSRPILMR